MEKTIRFGDLVRNAGRPQTFALWTDPKKSRLLNKATRENRVLTIIQEPTSKRKDFGMIGFLQEPNAMYLLFPRAVPREQGRVIGLNYALIDEPPVRNPVDPTESAQRDIQKTKAKPRKRVGTEVSQGPAI